MTSNPGGTIGGVPFEEHNLTDRLGEALTEDVDLDAALDYWDNQFQLDDEEADDFLRVLIVAARLVAEARQPDYEAANRVWHEEFQRWWSLNKPFEEDVEAAALRIAEAMVAAALGVEPGQRVKVVIMDD